MSYSEDVAAVRSTLHAAAQLSVPTHFTLHGMHWRLESGVFPTTITAGTDVFAWGLRGRFYGRFCEMGCGAGVISTLAAIGGADVTALDLNENAVGNTISNASMHSVGDRVNAYVSNLFSELPDDQLFDTIFWNVPWGFLREDDSPHGDFERSVFDAGYNLQSEYLKTGQRHLKPGGQLLIGTTDIGDIELLGDLAARLGLQLEIKFEEIRAEVQGLTRYIIFEAIHA